MTQELLIKFLNDKCTNEEINKVLQWIKNDSLDNQSKSWGYQDWTDFKMNNNLVDNDNLSSLLDKIHHKININRRRFKNPNASITKWVTSAAAILLIPVLALLLFTIAEKKSEIIKYSANIAVDSLEITAPIGSRTMVQLSDGSKVYLNYGSKLKYPQNFTGDTREVILLGEGYFNIAHNPEKPFIVKTGKIYIKALGTKFNVQAYPGEEIISTTLIEGKVLVEKKKTNGNIKTIGAMEPGQHVNYNINNELVTSTKGSIEKYIAWKDGKLVFENESIAEVTDRLSRMFNVDFEIADNVKDYSYTVTLVDEPLFQILDLMTIATPISYKALTRKKLSDGTFSKQKIIIEKRIK